MTSPIQSFTPPPVPAKPASPGEALARKMMAVRQAQPTATELQARAEPERPTDARAFAREAPFGSERPRYQRPGSLLDIRV